MKNLFFNALKLNVLDKAALGEFSRATGIALERLFYYNKNNIIPDKEDLKKIHRIARITEYELMLKMGIFESGLLSLIQKKRIWFTRPFKIHLKRKPLFLQSHRCFLKQHWENYIRGIVLI